MGITLSRRGGKETTRLAEEKLRPGAAVRLPRGGKKKKKTSFLPSSERRGKGPVLAAFWGKRKKEERVLLGQATS